MSDLRTCAVGWSCLWIAFWATVSSGAEKPLPDRVQFNRDIRPIFSDTCFRCHGPDAKARKAKLRLDIREEAIAIRGDHAAIVPGKSSSSEAYLRLVTSHADDLMPPADSNKKLSSREIAMIRRWIDQGAEYQSHWAYAPLASEGSSTVSPSSKGGSPIDRMIRERLDQEGLKPSPIAEPVVLARRVCFDLTGLPPDLRDPAVRAFLEKPSETHYRQLVDALLASPRFGERMAVWWLDLARYADTVGYHGDVPMSVWPYRDYVIRSFNQNKPFDRFTIEQIAGDLLPDATQEQKVASTYNRLLQTTEEGGAQAKEYEFIYACDRVRNTAITWMGATLLCSQCHDHKYDPYTMRDFYSFAAFFADIQEPIVGSRGRGLLLPNPEQSAQLESMEASLRNLRTKLDTSTPELESAQLEWERSFGESPQWTVWEPGSWKSEGSTILQVETNGIVRAKGPYPEKETYTLTFAGVEGAWTGLRLEVMDDDALPSRGPGTASNGNFVLNEVAFSRANAGTEALESIAFRNAAVDFSQDGFQPSKLIDGKRDTSGWAVLPQVGKSHVAVFEWSQVLKSAPTDRFQLSLTFHSQYGQHQIGKFRISLTAHPHPSIQLGLPSKIHDLLSIETSKRTEDQRRELAAYYRSMAPQLDGVRSELKGIEKKKNEFTASLPSCLVTVSGPPKDVRLHPRGNWMNETGDPVVPGVPKVLGSLATTGRATRLDLAQWLVSPTNALTARVTVNRIWKLFFGTGLSKTLYDSGSQGEIPSHPELLDWLASEFVHSHWDVKHLVRDLVTCKTYQQGSVPTPEQRERDPYNRLYARQSSFRLDAEFIRDNALAASGLLVEKVGGPSVFPYQPPGYWAPLNFPVREWQNSKGPDLYRRGLYTHWQRTFLHPSLAAFDACTREESTAERSRSNIPQQALVLLNDPTYVEAARVLASHAIQNGGPTAPGRVAYLFQSALNRRPKSSETAMLLDLQKAHWNAFNSDPGSADQLIRVGDTPVNASIPSVELASWTSVARAVLNLHETITRE